MKSEIIPFLWKFIKMYIEITYENFTIVLDP